MLNIDAIGSGAAPATKASVSLLDSDSGAFAKEMQGAMRAQAPQKQAPLQPNQSDHKSNGTHATQAKQPQADKTNRTTSAPDNSDPHRQTADDTAQGQDDAAEVAAAQTAAMAAAMIPATATSNPTATPGDETAAQPMQAVTAQPADPLSVHNGEPTANQPVDVSALTAQASDAAQSASSTSAATIATQTVAHGQTAAQPAQTNNVQPQMVEPTAGNAPAQEQLSDLVESIRVSTAPNEQKTPLASPLGTQGAPTATESVPQADQQVAQIQTAPDPAQAQPIEPNPSMPAELTQAEPAKAAKPIVTEAAPAEQAAAAPESASAPINTSAAENKPDAQAQGDAQAQSDAQAETKANTTTHAPQKAETKETKVDTGFDPAQPVHVKVPEGKVDVQATQTKQAVTEAVADKIGELVQAEQNQVKIQLKPDVLGGMTIKLSLAQGGLKVRLLTNGGETQALVSDQIAQLKEALRERGVTVTQMEVIDQSATQTSSQQPSNPHEQQQQGRYTRRAAYAVSGDLAIEGNAVNAVYASMIRVDNPNGSLEFSA